MFNVTDEIKIQERIKPDAHVIIDNPKSNFNGQGGIVVEQLQSGYKIDIGRGRPLRFSPDEIIKIF